MAGVRYDDDLDTDSLLQLALDAWNWRWHFGQEILDWAATVVAKR